MIIVNSSEFAKLKRKIKNIVNRAYYLSGFSGFLVCKLPIISTFIHQTYLHTPNYFVKLYSVIKFKKKPHSFIYWL